MILPGVVSIVANTEVHTAQAPPGWDGWVSARRIAQGAYALGDAQAVPARYLPDGGAVVLTLLGKVLILNADGSERIRLALALHKDSLVDPVLQEQYSDLLYRAPRRTGQSLALYILFAHKSRAEWCTPIVP